MDNKEMPKVGKFAVFKSFIIFNLAALVGFILGTAAFGALMYVYLNPTVAWLFANGIGGISHFGSNYIMQRYIRTKKKIIKNLIIFYTAGIIALLVSTIVFEVVIILIQEPIIAWVTGSLIGTLVHFIFNRKAISLSKS